MTHDKLEGLCNSVRNEIKNALGISVVIDVDSSLWYSWQGSSSMQVIERICNSIKRNLK